MKVAKRFSAKVNHKTQRVHSVEIEIEPTWSFFFELLWKALTNQRVFIEAGIEKK